MQTELANAKATLALAGERDASAAFIGSQQATEEALRTPRVNQTNAEGAAATALEQSRLADAMFRGAQTTTENALRTPKVDKTNAEGAAATALAAERNAASDLNRAKTDSEGRIILNAGQTIVTTGADGQQETFTAPENVEVVLEPGEEAVVISADGSQTRLKGPPGTRDPKDGAAFLEGIDSQLNTFFESEAWSKVSPTLSRRIRSAMTSASKGQDLTAAAERIQELMSDTYKGQNVVELQGGWGDGTAFYVPGYILNFISDAIANNSTPKASAIAKEYGLSLQESESVLKFLGVQNG